MALEWAMAEPRNTKLKKLEFSIFRDRPSFREDGKQLGESDRVLIAVSGGIDSVALLHVLVALQKRWGFYAEVAYVHHGERGDVSRQSQATNRYRRRAEKKVQALAASFALPFVALRNVDHRVRTKSHTEAHESEEMLRETRLKALKKHAVDSGAVAIVLGHHRDDLFETRLIRLIRGTGPQGLMAMSVVSRLDESGRASGERCVFWRPFLSISRAEIEAYMSEKGLRKNRDWVDDPSNRNARYLRNDLRRRLIPLIDRIRPGGVSAMGRSLQLIVDQLIVDQSDVEHAPDGESRLEVQFLNRADLLALSPVKRRSRFAHWLRNLEIRDISRSQIDEILKRIDTSQKRLSFEVGGRVWMIDTRIRIGSTTR